MLRNQNVEFNPFFADFLLPSTRSLVSSQLFCLEARASSSSSSAAASKTNEAQLRVPVSVGRDVSALASGVWLWQALGSEERVVAHAFLANDACHSHTPADRMAFLNDGTVPSKAPLATASPLEMRLNECWSAPSSLSHQRLGPAVGTPHKKRVDFKVRPFLAIMVRELRSE